jgi:uncharacterized protein involved in type VI secretion and phage assembly
MENLEKVVANLVQQIERRFYGKYRGFVVDNADPEQLGRLKVKIPSVLGDEVVTGWAMPCVPYGGDADQGFLFIPEVDAGVWVEFEEGDLEFPIWVGTFWSKPGGESELPKPNDADGEEEGSVQDPPTRKIIKSKKGHTIQLEDADGEEMVMLCEAENGHVVMMNKGGIKITEGVKGHVVTMNQDGIKITDGANGHEVTLNAQGVGVQDGKNQHSIALDMTGVTVEAKTGAKVALTAAGASVDAGAGIVEVKGSVIKLSTAAALPVIRVTDQGIGNLGAPVVLAGPGNPTVLA